MYQYGTDYGGQLKIRLKQTEGTKKVIVLGMQLDLFQNELTVGNRNNVHGSLLNTSAGKPLWKM